MPAAPTRSTANSPWHAGELAVQARAGRQFPGRPHTVIPPVAATFAAAQPVCTIAGVGRGGLVWASMLTGPIGFLSAPDEHTLHVKAQLRPDDPLYPLLAQGGQVGMIIYDSRRRMRVNGALEPSGDGFDVRASEVFSNCGRYISERHPTPTVRPPVEVSTGGSLTPGQADLIRTADTFLIGSRHPDGPADASHRGGNPGFVHVEAPSRLTWPDYDGNNMYATLGNITLDPHVGLLFLDWTQGTLLQISGRATLDWSPAAAAGFAGALRVVRLAIDAVRQTEHAVALSWTPAVLNSHNPPRATRPRPVRQVHGG